MNVLVMVQVAVPHLIPQSTVGSSDGSNNIKQNSQHESKCSGVGASCSDSASNTAIIEEADDGTNSPTSK